MAGVSEVHSAPNAPPAEATLAEPADAARMSKEHRIPRDDARDLVFVGRLLGEGTVVSGKPRANGDVYEYERSMTVAIYLTGGGAYVVHEERIREWGNACSDVVTVILPSVPDDERSVEERLLASLRLGTATRDAWNEACESHPPLASFAVERIA